MQLSKMRYINEHTNLIYLILQTVISYLPLAHVYGFVAECIVLFVGGKIGYSRGKSINIFFVFWYPVNHSLSNGIVLFC